MFMDKMDKEVHVLAIAAVSDPGLPFLPEKTLLVPCGVIRHIDKRVHSRRVSPSGDGDSERTRDERSGQMRMPGTW